jgi:hypothetical protein
VGVNKDKTRFMWFGVHGLHADYIGRVESQPLKAIKEGGEQKINRTRFISFGVHGLQPTM